MRTLQAVLQMINHIEKVLIYSLLSDGLEFWAFHLNKDLVSTTQEELYRVL